MSGSSTVPGRQPRRRAREQRAVFVHRVHEAVRVTLRIERMELHILESAS